MKAKVTLGITGILLLTILFSAYLMYRTPENVTTENFSPSVHTYDSEDVEFVGTLTDDDGEYQGDVSLIVSSSTRNIGLDNVFDTLYITRRIEGKDVILYTINSEGFYSIEGLEQNVAGMSDVRAFQLAYVGGSSVVVYVLFGNNYGATDPLTVGWSEEDNTFKIMRPDSSYIPEDIVEFGQLIDADGSVLGDVSGVYLDEDKKILKSIYVSKEEPHVSTTKYRITNLGFFNDDGKELKINNDDFYGYELISIDGDSFTVRILADNGTMASNEIVVRWNYTNAVFEIDPDSMPRR